MVTIVTGGHFGDEGKGKIVSYLALKDKPDIVARAGVGPNAGHTVYKDGKEFGLRMVPCGFVNEGSRLMIGAGVLVNPEVFLEEVDMTGIKGRIFLDKRCAIIEEKHRTEDTSNSFLKEKVGTTGSGCGPA
ncbi:MAG: adenylosuccinate synthetase, partial [Candidatus Altiarchaeota archaeon]|nr:adenylosuccinate synthetase [Candidatus Altiarchaeota archaeon]